MFIPIFYSPHQIANVGPADYNYDETISTLRYANRAKNIQNKARINEDPKDALLRQFQKEIEELRKQLEDGKSKASLRSFVLLSNCFQYRHSTKYPKLGQYLLNLFCFL